MGFWLLLLLVKDDADDVSLVLLHVIHQPLLTGGLKATDTAAEQEHTVLHRWLACAWLALGLRLELSGVLPLGVCGVTRPL